HPDILWVCHACASRPMKKNLATLLALYVGRCYFILVLALVCDVAGLVLLLLGIFGLLSSWDFFVYSGALLLAFSLLFWAFWYSLNIEVSLKELARRTFHLLEDYRLKRRRDSHRRVKLPAEMNQHLFCLLHLGRWVWGFSYII
uniref:Transmembrane protein 238 like n=1 Tax=Podarcis muralis TaxID=64176 RepID=A0A670JJB5_PODMU